MKLQELNQKELTSINGGDSGNGFLGGLFGGGSGGGSNSSTSLLKDFSLGSGSSSFRTTNTNGTSGRAQSSQFFLSMGSLFHAMSMD